MKYDVLGPYRQYLYENFTKNTARKYYSAFKKLVNDQQFTTARDIRLEGVEKKMAEIFRTKNEFSAAKNSLIQFRNCYQDVTIPAEENFKEISCRKRNYSKKPKKCIYIDSINRTINQIQNKKLKYAYRLALISGLRVSELADLEAGDITFSDGNIIVTIRSGKGGKYGTVGCMKDEYMYTNLQEYIRQHPEGKIFCSEVYLREVADKLGFECHDLRRAFAIQYRNSIKGQMPIEEANKLTQEKLRHERFSTTKRYLFNRKLAVRTKREGDNTENGKRS